MDNKIINSPLLLQNIQLPLRVATPATENKNIEENENTLKLTSEETVEHKYQSSDSKIENNTVNNSGEEKKSFADTVDNEEEELEFLLSLKEPVHTGPVIVKNNFDFENG